jgi:hypothetical protein
VPTLIANLKVQNKKDTKSNSLTLNDKKTDLFASGYMSTLASGMSTSLLMSQSGGVRTNVLGENGASTFISNATASSEEQSEKFFDARLK